MECSSKIYIKYINQIPFRSLRRITRKDQSIRIIFKSASLAWLLDVVQGLLLDSCRRFGRVGHLGRGGRKVRVALNGSTAHRAGVHGNWLLVIK